jgi:hypothetical protein
LLVGVEHGSLCAPECDHEGYQNKDEALLHNMTPWDAFKRSD